MKQFLWMIPLSASMCGLAMAQDHSDISPRVSGGKIVADAHDDGSGMTFPLVRVFGYDFGEDADDPFFIGDPGFNAAAGSGLPAGSRIGFQVLNDLKYWDGAGSVGFGAVPSGETLKLQFGSQSRTAGTGTGTLSNLLFGPTVGASGTFHEHLASLLMGSDGNIEPASTTPGWPGIGYAGDGIQAAAGIYMLELKITSNDLAIQPSDPIWILYNHGLDEEVHDQAIDWVNTNLVPEPTAIGSIALGSLLLIRRRNS